jgi:hypothetical protein
MQVRGGADRAAYIVRGQFEPVSLGPGRHDPQSPWTTTLRGALFGDTASALASGQTAITASLGQ